MSLADFKNYFSGGSRSNRFYVEGRIPGFQGPAGSNPSSDAFTKFHIQATSIPPVSTTGMYYDHFGRKYYYPGEKTYGTWSFTVLDDVGTKNDLWKKFHVWQDSINSNYTNYSYQSNSATSDTSDSAQYKAHDWRIHHLGLNGEDQYLKTYVMHGCWPQVIQPIRFNMSSQVLPNSFTVIIVYDYIELYDNGGRITATN